MLQEVLAFRNLKTLHDELVRSKLKLADDNVEVTFHVEEVTVKFAKAQLLVESVHLFMIRSRVSKSCLKAELCFHRYVYFPLFRYMFSAFTTSSVLVIRRN